MTHLPTVLVVEDDPAVRDSLSELVRSLDLRVECFHSAEDFLKRANLLRASCMIVDVCLPGLNGLELHETLVVSETPVPVIMISGHADVQTSVRSMKLGVFDFLEKPYRPSELRASIRQAVEKDTKQRDVASRLRRCKARLATLTNDERLILEGIGIGKTNKMIAEELDISLRTMQFRRSSLNRKLNVSSRVELVQFYLLVRDVSPRQ